MRSNARLSLSARVLLLCAMLFPVGTATVSAQSTVAPNFRYNVISVSNTAPGQNPVVVFSVTDPTNGNAPYNIKTHPAFTQTASGNSRLFVQIGWDTKDFNNKGSGSETAPVGAAAAQPIGINALAASVAVGDGTFRVTSPRPIPLTARGTGEAAMEGHPAGPDATGAFTVRLQVKSVYRYFTITDTSIVARRAVVDINNCLKCHGTLSLHGNNRTNEVQVCVVCHNPNATDIPYRLATDGPESPTDFKYMVHAIHAGGFRTRPFVVIGFNHSVNDFSGVRFPSELRNCLNCHIDRTFELPLGPNTLGTTIDTRSSFAGGIKVVDGDPSNDLNITPTAAVCSSCHTKSEDRRHMTSNGASFSILQKDIGTTYAIERCASCHGPGKKMDVRRVHEVGSNDD